MDNAAYSGMDGERKDTISGTIISETRVDVTDDVYTSSVSHRSQSFSTKPYAGMGKEDLLRFSQTPFWNRLRLASVVLFWLCWLGLLVAVIALTILLPRCKPPPEQDWWQKSTFYQVYVRSFYDNNADGVGDLKGVQEKLDHVSLIGVDAVILSSFGAGQSGEVDFGYELTDHTAVDPIYGTMDDFSQLLEDAHLQGIRVLIDFVPNYTGDQHEWFESSRSSSNLTNPYWNYYIWADCQPNQPPNNWRSVYGNSSWSYDDSRQQCYLHQFLSSQPELNLRSAAVRQQLEDVLRFWLELGVDGFRVNSPAFLFEDADLRDEPVTDLDGCQEQNPYNCLDHIYTRNQPEITDLLVRWRSILDEYSQAGQERVLLVDGYENVTITSDYHGKYGSRGAQLPINYHLRHVTTTCGGLCVRNLVNDWLDAADLTMTSTWATSSQDLSRLTSILGEEKQTISTLLTLTLPGVPIIYYGQEIGMVNGNMTGRQSLDPMGWTDPTLSRDQYRSPMQWSGEQWGGFMNLTVWEEEGETSSPWLPVNEDYTSLNVQKQSLVSDVVQTHLDDFRTFTLLRHDKPAVHLGHYREAVVNENIFSYMREYDGKDTVLIALNFGDTKSVDDYSSAVEYVPASAEVYYTNSGSTQGLLQGANTDLTKVELYPGEGAIFLWPYQR